MKKRKWLIIAGIAVLGFLFSGCDTGNEIENGVADHFEGKLLILQAYGSSGSAGGATRSFVELYNAAGKRVNLTGITLYYANGTSVASDALPNDNDQDGPWRMISLIGTLSAGASFLVLGPIQNTTGRLKITDNSGDINDSNFTLSNRAFKVALIRGTGTLTVQNPFNTDGNGTKAAGYIDMVGSANAYSDDGSERDRIFGFETAPARNSASVAVRRKSLADTNNNSADFAGIDYRAWSADNPDRTTDEQLAIYRPKNRAFGTWNPFVDP